jgi:hypothetical protein
MFSAFPFYAPCTTQIIEQIRRNIYTPCKVAARKNYKALWFNSLIASELVPWYWTTRQYNRKEQIQFSEIFHKYFFILGKAITLKDGQ